MLLKIVFLVLAAHSKTQPVCRDTGEAYLQYKQDILAATESHKGTDKVWLNKISLPLKCLFLGREKSRGLDQYLAGAFLEGLMGGSVPQGLPTDPRYKKTAEIFQRLSFNSPDIVKESILADFAQAEWALFEGWGTGYSAFLPEEKMIHARPPLLAASSMIHLKKAYHDLHGHEKTEVAKRIKNLYQTTPKSAVLQRKVIDQIYQELFVPKIKLNLSMS